MAKPKRRHVPVTPGLLSNLILDGELPLAEVKERHRRSVEESLRAGVESFDGWETYPLPDEVIGLIEKIQSGGRLEEADVKTYHVAMAGRSRAIAPPSRAKNKMVRPLVSEPVSGEDA
jgi:hypothetical protein